VKSLACLTASGNGDVSSGQATITMPKQTEGFSPPLSSCPCLQPSLTYTLSDSQNPSENMNPNPLVDREKALENQYIREKE